MSGAGGIGITGPMAELPEITLLARQMSEHLGGFKLISFSLGQKKSLNRPAQDYENLSGRRLLKARGHGKWLILEFEPPGPNLLIHPGMGMDLLASSVKPPLKPQFVFEFEAGRGFWLRFWWFGHLRLADSGRELEAAGGLGPAPLSPQFTPQALERLMESKPRTSLKSFLTDQKNIAGIGNVYVQDICFRLKAHPLTKLGALSRKQRRGLFDAVEETLTAALERGINYFEFDFWGSKGEWGREAFLVGYKTGQPCPACGQAILKIKAHTSASYICPCCQPEKRA